MPLDPIFGSILGLGGGIATNAMSMQLGREQMAFQERMSSTAYQRQVADMRAAGLNPIMAAMRGGGASTPSGSLPSLQNPAANLGSEFSAGYLARITKDRYENIEKPTAQANIDNIKADTEFKNTQAETSRTQQGGILAQINKADQDRAESAARILAMQHSNDLADAQKDLARAGIPAKQAEGKLMSGLGDAIGYLFGQSKKGGQYKPGESMKDDLALLWKWAADPHGGGRTPAFGDQATAAAVGFIRDHYESFKQILRNLITPANAVEAATGKGYEK